MANNYDITLQITHTTENSNGLQNQTLVALFFQVLIDKINEKENKNHYKISFISNDAKILSLIRFEIMKLDDYEIEKVQNFSNSFHWRQFWYLLKIYSKTLT